LGGVALGGSLPQQDVNLPEAVALMPEYKTAK
jgi:hypothetical protein